MATPWPFYPKYIGINFLPFWKNSHSENTGVQGGEKVLLVLHVKLFKLFLTSLVLNPLQFKLWLSH